MRAFCVIIVVILNQREKLPDKVINIKRKKYAVGLFWQPAMVGVAPRAYARALARGMNRKLNLFTEYRTLIGLGARRAGHRIGMSSAAAEVMDALTEYNSFLGVFDTENGFYLVAVRNGIILQDKLFDSQDAARAEYFRLSEIPDWGALFAPSAWGMPRAIERNLSDLISGGARATLRPISRFRRVLLSVVLLAVFVFFLLSFFREPIRQMMTPPQVAKINPELAAEYKRQIAEKNKELDAAFDIEKKTAPAPIVMPYDELPDVTRRAQVCYQAIGFVMQPIPGWNQVSAECGETHASARFKRSFGTLGDFYSVATELMPAAYVNEESADVVTVRATLPTVPTVASVDERDIDTVLRAIQTAFQGISTDVETNVATDTLSNGVDVATVNLIEVAAESKMTPMQFMKIFDDFGGVYMTRCTWDASRRIWNYEVIIYVK